MSVIGISERVVAKHAKNLVLAIAKQNEAGKAEYTRELQAFYENAIQDPGLAAEFKKEQAALDAKAKEKDAKGDAAKKTLENWVKEKITAILVNEIDQSIYRKGEGVDHERYGIPKDLPVKDFHGAAANGDSVLVMSITSNLQKVLTELVTSPAYCFIEKQSIPKVHEFLNGKFLAFTFDDVISGRKNLSSEEKIRIKNPEYEPIAMPLFLAVNWLAGYPPEGVEGEFPKTVAYLHSKGANFKDTIARFIFLREGDPDKLSNLLAWVKMLNLKVDPETIAYATQLLIRKLEGLFKPDNSSYAVYKKWLDVFREMAVVFNINEMGEDFLQKLMPGLQQDLMSVIQKVCVMKSKQTLPVVPAPEVKSNNKESKSADTFDVSARALGSLQGANSPVVAAGSQASKASTVSDFTWNVLPADLPIVSKVESKRHTGP